MNYTYRDEAQTAALKRLSATAYAVTDKPFLFTQRYSLSPDFEPSDMTAKLQVDTQGCMDNLYSLRMNQELQGRL